MPAQRHDLIGSGWSFPPMLDFGNVALATGEEEIMQAIRIILETPVGARMMRPEFGSRLHELVFASISAATLATARHYVEQALGYWEPRITLNDVDVQPHAQHPEILMIAIDYTIRATYDERSLVVPFYTIPGEAI
jgi:uncharacterized protein